MKSFRDYLTEAEDQHSRPVTGDNFAINIREECLLETYICEEREDGIVLHADDRMMSLLENYGLINDEAECVEECDCEYDEDDHEDDHDDVDRGEYDYEGDMAKDDLATIVRAARRLNGMLDDNENMPEWVQSKINKAADYVDTAADYIESNKSQDVAEETDSSAYYHEKLAQEVFDMNPNLNASGMADEVINAAWPLMVRDLGKKTAFSKINYDEDFPSDFVSAYAHLQKGHMDEAKYQGREVPLGKPMAGDVKKSKVYVRGPKGNVVKVNFGHGGTSAKRAGQKTMKIKKSNPARRKSFRARHNCDNPGPRWKARYWSCRAW